MEEVVSEHFGFRQTETELGLKVFDSSFAFADASPNVNLFRIGNRLGTYVCSNSNQIKFGKLQDLNKDDVASATTIEVSGAHQLEYNHDESKIYFIAQNGISYITVSDGAVHQSTQKQVSLILPSPVNETIAYISDSQLYLDLAVLHSARVFGWSLDGKRLHIGDADSVKTIDTNGQELSATPFPEIDDASDLQAVNIVELDSANVFVAFTFQEDDEAAYKTYLLSNGEFHEADVAVPFGSIERKNFYYTARLAKWHSTKDFIFVTSGAATDLNTLCVEDKKVELIMQADDTMAATFPMTEDGDDMSPLGIDIDLSNVSTTVKDLNVSLEEATGLPKIWMLTHEFTLISWWIYDVKLVKDKAVSLEAARAFNQAPATGVENTKPAFESSEKPATSEKPAFGSSGFGASASDKPAFGTNSTSSDKPAIGFGAQPFGSTDSKSTSTGFGSATPAFGSTGFGASTDSKPAFGSTGFGASKPAFGSGLASSSEPKGFGSTGFGSQTGHTFGATSFGAGNSSGFGSSGFGSKLTTSGGSGFANYASTAAPAKKENVFGGSSSTVSPFASLKGNNIFESSGSDASPFGQSSTFGKPSTSPFAELTKKDSTSPFGDPKESKAPFSDPTKSTSSNDKPSGGGFSFGAPKSDKPFGAVKNDNQQDTPSFGSVNKQQDKKPEADSLFGSFGSSLSLGDKSQDKPAEKSLFGSTKTDNSPVFGNKDSLGFGSKNESESKPLFGKPEEAKPLFGSKTDAKPLFGANTENKEVQKPFTSPKEEPKPFGSGSLFSPKKEDAKSSTASSLFSPKKEDPKPSTGSLFGQKKEEPKTSTGSLFGQKKEEPFGSGSSLFGNKKEEPKPFGSTASPLFDQKKEEKPFGSTASPLFAQKNEEKPFGSTGSLFGQKEEPKPFGSSLGSKDGAKTSGTLFGQKQDQTFGSGFGAKEEKSLLAPKVKPLITNDKDGKSLASFGLFSDGLSRLSTKTETPSPFAHLKSNTPQAKAEEPTGPQVEELSEEELAEEEALAEEEELVEDEEESFEDYTEYDINEPPVFEFFDETAEVATTYSDPIKSKIQEITTKLAYRLDVLESNHELFESYFHANEEEDNFETEEAKKLSLAKTLKVKAHEKADKVSAAVQNVKRLAGEVAELQKVADNNIVRKFQISQVISELKLYKSNESQSLVRYYPLDHKNQQLQLRIRKKLQEISKTKDELIKLMMPLKSHVQQFSVDNVKGLLYYTNEFIVEKNKELEQLQKRVNEAHQPVVYTTNARLYNKYEISNNLVKSNPKFVKLNILN